MSTYLCVTPYDDVYPSEAYADFEAEEHILACGDNVTPLLWLAMFRDSDLRNGTPIAPRQLALTQLYAAVPILGESVAASAEHLREAMRWMPGSHVTIEWWDGDQQAPPASLRLDSLLVHTEGGSVEQLLGRSHLRMVPWETPF